MIKVENLVKSFGAKRVVDDISFNVERGEVLGFIGPNGAGKSITVRIINGFYPRPPAGSQLGASISLRTRWPLNA